MAGRIAKVVVAAGVCAGFLAFIALGGQDALSLSGARERLDALFAMQREHPIGFAASFLALYVVCTALSFPGATVLTLLAGALFGLWKGTLIVSIASTLGATCAFLIARFVLRDWVRTRFAERLKAIDAGVAKDGAQYLFFLRLVPIFPFFLVNLAMGVTAFPLLRYAAVSCIGMLPGTAVYVNAGRALESLTSLGDIARPGFLASMALLGVVPLVLKKALAAFKGRKALSRYKRPARFDFNVVVVGAGSAGLVTSYIAAAVKAKVALIERHRMGGDCLNTGCVPSKALLRSAKMAAYARRAHAYGIDGTQGMKVDFARVMERVRDVITRIEPHDSVERYAGLGVECISGDARVVSPYEVEVNGRTLTAKTIVIATGARPFVPNLPGLADVPHYTSDTIWELRSLPGRLIVLGGGPIGCELAQAFARLGARVIQVELSDRLLPREDPEASAHVLSALTHDGVDVRTGHKAIRCERGDAGERRLVCTDAHGSEVAIACDAILVALGRRANTSGFGLEEIGVELRPDGTVACDAFLRTNIPNIYVCGDVTGPFQFTHAAAHQAWYAAVNALFSPFKSFAVDYRVIPWATFTDPEVARVGLNETEARQRGVPHEVTVYGIDDLDRAIADGEAHGFVKVITAKGSDRILGATIVGHDAGELITEYVSAMKHGFGMNKILGTIHVYPTFSEANKYAAGAWKKAHAPQGLLAWVERFHAWRRG